MSEGLLSQDDGQVKAAGFLIDSYSRRESQAELTIPYAFPMDVGESLLGAIFKTRMHRYLIDIDGPWLVAFASSIFISNLLAMFAVHSGYERHLAVGTAVVTWPVVLFICYWSTALINFRLRYGRQWLRTIMGPTHLGLTPTGVKCYWKGKFFYNYPLLRSWSNVRRVDVEWQNADDLQSQTKIFFSFAGRLTHSADMRLPISGFRNRGHLLALLNYLDKHLPQAAFGEQLEQDRASGFERTLKAFDESKQWEIELKP